MCSSLERLLSLEEGKELLGLTEPDLLFLDIQLSDGTGFDLLESLPDLNAHVIFTTAYSEYAIKAIKHSAMDYLLKPVSGADLKAAVDRIVLSEKKALEKVVKGLAKNRLSQQPVRKIALQTSEGIHLYESGQIVRCQSDGNYTKVFFSNNKKMMVAKTLKDFEEMLLPFGFERIHHSHLINLAHLESYVNRDNGYVIMSDQHTLPVSKRKKARLLEVLANLNNL